MNDILTLSISCPSPAKTYSKTCGGTFPSSSQYHLTSTASFLLFLSFQNTSGNPLLGFHWSSWSRRKRHSHCMNIPHPILQPLLPLSKPPIYTKSKPKKNKKLRIQFHTLSSKGYYKSEICSPAQSCVLGS